VNGFTIISKLILFTLLIEGIGFSQSDNDLDSLYQKNPSSRPVINSFDYYFNKAEKAIEKREYVIADGCLDTASLIALSEMDELRAANVFTKLGQVKTLLGDYSAAIQNYTYACDLYEKNEEFILLTSCHVDLAELFRKIPKHDIARDHIQTAKELYTKHNLSDTVLLIRIYNRSAAINQESNPNISFMLNDSYKAIELAKSIHSDYYVAVSMNELGYMYKNHLKITLSDSCYKEAEQLWMRSGHFEDALYTMNNRAMLYVHNDYNKDETFLIYKRIAFLADSLGIFFTLHDPYYYLYQHYLDQGDSAHALKYFIKVHEVDVNTASIKHNYNLHNLTAKYQNKKIQDKYNDVNEILNQTNNELSTKRSETRNLFISIAVLVILISIISFLLIKIRKSNKILLDKNKEKDSLIQEIHHRVKNNLQFISSLLNMQMKTAIKPEESKSLTEASRRINAMALVHEMLYNRAEQKGIAVKYYLEELTESLNTLINSDERQIDFELDIIDVNLDVSDTISIGMITSELVSNSMKHAFLKIEHPKVSLQLIQTGNFEFQYTIKDNGAGFNEDIKGENRLGLRLVDIFSRQLKGNYSIDGKNGFTYTLTFNKKK